MERRKVLIVSDSPDRKAYLEFQVRSFHLQPVWYPNILAARMAVRKDSFLLALVDLAIPLEPKLALIQEYLQWQKEGIVVTIGKREYLDKKKPVPEADSITKLSSIESIPVFVREWQRRLVK